MMNSSLQPLSPLQSIPEHDSQADHVDSRLYPPRPPSQTNSSTRGVRDARLEASVVSDAHAVLADRTSTSSSDGSKQAAARKRRRRLFHIVGFAVVVTAIVVVAIVLVVYLGPNNPSPTDTSNDNSNTSQSDDAVVDGSGASAPSSSTLAPDVTTEMVQQVDAVLITISDPNDLADPSTPQYKARNWLLTQDLLLQDVLWEGSERLTQRYIAELFFWCLANNATDYLLADASECDWKGLSCPEQERGHVLTGIKASGQNLTGSLPSELAQLTTLQQLEISDNQITGTLASDFFDSWTQLYSLDVSENGLSGTLPASLWALTDLRYLFASSNQFTGAINDSLLPDRSSLVDVWIHENDLTGTLPMNFFASARKLHTWSAYDNQLTGELPSTMATRNLTFFDVSINKLNGTLDSLASALLGHESLETLYLDSNQLYGTLPSNLNSSAPLKRFWLQNNTFEGSIPSNFGMLWNQLKDLRLQKNDLLGNITDLCSSWPQLETLEADCRVKSNGKVDIECDCCTDCQ